MRQLMIGLCLMTVGLAEAGERWQSLALPGEPAIRALGEVPFPDGQRAIWIGTDQGSFRRIDGQWQRWPMIEGDNPVVRDVLVAPDQDGLTTWWLATPDGLLLTRDGQTWRRHTDADTALADRDILSLHLSQSRDGRPEVWIGSRSGLTIWRMGQWAAVLARPDGFQGGPVTAIRGLFHQGRRQTWVLGPTGISRLQSGQWQRWASDCLRGHQLTTLETLETPAQMLLLVGSDRGIRQLSLDDPDSCARLPGGDRHDGPVLELARDRHERLYLLRPGRVERFAPSRAADNGWHWTFFDHRDGLPGNIEWQGGHRLDAEGRLWVGSQLGLWTLDPAEQPGAPDQPPALLLSDGRQTLAANVESTMTIRTAVPELTLLQPASTRPHALRYRWRLTPTAAFGPWQANESLTLDALAFGRHRIGVEMADEFGRVHGVYEFTLQRQWPLQAWIGLALLPLLLGAGVVLLWQRGRR
jgi:hypothetical protein